MTALIWDLDGTLIDSYEVFLTALSATFSDFQLEFDREKVYQIIKTQSVNHLLEHQTADFEVLKRSFTAYTTSLNDEISLMPGAKEVLDWTKTQRISNFIYTHKGKNAYELLKQLGILDDFVEVVTSENGFERKPNPEGVNYLLEKYQLEKADTYYIGDRSLDVDVAHNSGIKSINFISADHSMKITELTDLIQILGEN